MIYKIEKENELSVISKINDLVICFLCKLISNRIIYYIF